MSEHDSQDSLAALPAPSTSTIEPPHRRLGGMAWIVAAVVAAGGGYWYWQSLDRARATSAESLATALRSDVDALRGSVATSRQEADALRARLDDAARVNESLRAQVLALSERARMSEEAIANLADKRLSGHDALLLNEAELLLVLAQERYALFVDPAPSLAAYRLADAALVQANDAAFASVRQSVEAEMAALSALQTTAPPTLQAQLAHLREALAVFPLGARDERGSEAASTSRFARIFGEFIRIRRDDDTAARFAHDDPLLARTLLDASLRDAQAALLVRDPARWQHAIATAQAQLAHDFDAASPEVGEARAQLDVMAKSTIAPATPTALGSALKELRNLRATHGLQTPASAVPQKLAPAATEAQS